MQLVRKSTISVAPMMDCTDRHGRYFLRLLAPDLRLYTEMLTAQAVVNGDRDHLLGHDAAEHPLAVQLAGNDPELLGRAAGIAVGYGYDEVNLNLGCPSDRVQAGGFGACLMLQPALVADCVAAMRAAVAAPVTVKMRIGVDEHDSYEFLAAFAETVAAAGCDTFIVHARKAILRGLSPSENLAVPPLDYDAVYRLKRDYPQLIIHINGGVTSVEQIGRHLTRVDGVMIGRKAYQDPYFLAAVQARFMSSQGGQALPSREAVVQAMFEYAARQSRDGVRIRHIARHMLGLYAGQRGARRWRRYVMQAANDPLARPELLLQSLQQLDQAH